MKAKVLLTLIISMTVITGFACTIGIASGSATSDGRPLMWKSRDVGGSQVVKYNNEGRNRFVGIGSTGSDYFWMGVNDKGFAIANALSSDLGRPMGNGDLMLYCLPICETLEEFETILDSTNTIGRETHGNFAVFDSTGAAAMYEIGPTEYWKFDTADAPDGYVVRTNFAINGGGGSGLAQFDRSYALLDSLLAEDNINYRSIIQIHSRDYSDADSQELLVPFEGQFDVGLPWGYIPANQSISNPGNGSAAIFRGVLPGEPSQLTVMWAMLGQPAGAIAVPIYPIGEPPVETNTDDTSPLCTQANWLRSHIYDCPTSSIYVDSYKLRNDDELGIWDQVFPAENQMFDDFEANFASWSAMLPTDQVILQEQQTVATFAYDFLTNVTVDTLMTADFTVDDVNPTPLQIVQFTDMSLHGPAAWNWDFENDGIYDSQEQNPQHAYADEGIYSVRLTVYNGDDSVSVVFEDYIEVEELTTDEPDAPGLATSLFSHPNPFNPSTTISFSLPHDSHVRLEVFDVRGRKIRSLADERYVAGLHCVSWNGDDEDGEEAGSGVYLIRLQTKDERLVRKVLMVK